MRAARLSLQALEAEGLAARRDWPEAMAVLKRMYAAAGTAPPSPILPAELNILTCQVAIGLHNGPLALAGAEIALSQLRSSAGRYTAADRHYLDRFSQALVNYCLFWRDQGIVRQLAPAISTYSVSAGG